MDRPPAGARPPEGPDGPRAKGRFRANRPAGYVTGSTEPAARLNLAYLR
jgi:hypothetical protein